MYQTQNVCLNDIARNTELGMALLDVDAKNQGTAGASELDLEHFVGR